MISTGGNLLTQQNLYSQKLLKEQNYIHWGQRARNTRNAIPAELQLIGTLEHIGRPEMQLNCVLLDQSQHQGPCSTGMVPEL